MKMILDRDLFSNSVSFSASRYRMEWYSFNLSVMNLAAKMDFVSMLLELINMRNRFSWDFSEVSQFDKSLLHQLFNDKINLTQADP